MFKVIDIKTPCSSVSFVNFEHVIAGWVKIKDDKITNRLFYLKSLTVTFFTQYLC